LGSDHLSLNSELSGFFSEEMVEFLEIYSDKLNEFLAQIVDSSLEFKAVNPPFSSRDKDNSLTFIYLFLRDYWQSIAEALEANNQIEMSRTLTQLYLN
jgi:hypothetical protein